MSDTFGPKVPALIGMTLAIPFLILLRLPTGTGEANMRTRTTGAEVATACNCKYRRRRINSDVSAARHIAHTTCNKVGSNCCIITSNKLIADSEVRGVVGRKAKQRIEEGYLWPVIARQIEQVYLEMMGWMQEPRSGLTELPTIATRRGSAA